MMSPSIPLPSLPLIAALLLTACSTQYLPDAAATTTTGPSTTSETEGWSDGHQTPACKDLSDQTLAILASSCAGCHGPDSSGQGNFDYVLDLEALLTSGKVKAGAPAESLLYQRIENGSMPPQGAEPRPSDADATIVSRWISECTVSCDEPTFVTDDEMIRLMLDDVLTVDLEDRSNIRYFTLTHLYNSGFCDDELDTYRFALSKLVNGLSQGIDVVAPRSIDPHRTIFRIDLTDYGWTPALWDSMVAQNPFAVRYINDNAGELIAQTRTAANTENPAFGASGVPFQTGDWLVASASRPPLYHEILHLPDHIYELPPAPDCLPRDTLSLEEQLGITIRGDIADAEVERAGFLQSGVSVNNRVVERHRFPATSARTFWISYDFTGNEQQRSVLSNPIDIHLAADGGEVIFNLPNGLQAYMLANRCGERIDKAPTAIVTDENQLDFAVVNGLSCMGCHSEGMKLIDDEVRPWVLGEGASLFDDQDVKTVLDLYPEHDNFRMYQTLDSQRFLTAQDQAGVAPDLTQEPTIAVDQAFARNLDLRRAAAEYGRTPSQLHDVIGRLDTDLQGLLDTTVKRQAFAATFAESICLMHIGCTSKCPFEPATGTCAGF